MTTPNDFRDSAEKLVKAAKEQLEKLGDPTKKRTVLDFAMIAPILGTTVGLGIVTTALSIDTRLRELVEQQRISNALTGTGHMGVLNSDAELRPAREAVRQLLNLEPTPITDEEAQRIGARLAEQFSDWVDVRAIGIHHGSPEVYAESDGARMLGRLAAAAMQEAGRG